MNLRKYTNLKKACWIKGFSQKNTVIDFLHFFKDLQHVLKKTVTIVRLFSLQEGYQALYTKSFI